MPAASIAQTLPAALIKDDNASWLNNNSDGSGCPEQKKRQWQLPPHKH
jgi:hypothetical protein